MDFEGFIETHFGREPEEGRRFSSVPSLVWVCLRWVRLTLACRTASTLYTPDHSKVSGVGCDFSRNYFRPIRGCQLRQEHGQGEIVHLEGGGRPLQLADVGAWRVSESELAQREPLNADAGQVHELLGPPQINKKLPMFTDQLPNFVVRTLGDPEVASPVQPHGDACLVEAIEN
jgi:hypothetical protein